MNPSERGARERKTAAILLTSGCPSSSLNLSRCNSSLQKPRLIEVDALDVCCEIKRPNNRIVILSRLDELLRLCLVYVLIF